MGNVLIAGNSKFVNKNLIKTTLTDAKWLDKVTKVTVTDANKTLLNEVHNLAKEQGFDVEVIEVPWRVTENGVERDDRGALFRVYGDLITKVNGICLFSTGEDRASDQLMKDANKVGRVAIAIEVQPEMAANIFTAPLEQKEQDKLQDFKEKHFANMDS